MDHQQRKLLEAEFQSIGGHVDSSFRVESLTHNIKNTITDGVWLVRSDTLTAVLKVVVYRPGGDPNWQPSTDPNAWNYWRREPDAYHSGLVHQFAQHGLSAPRCLALVERSDTELALWLEYVEGESGYAFGVDRIVELGYRLGCAQGAWARDSKQLPAFASRNFLRDYPASKTLGWELLDHDVAWQQPVVAQGFPAALRDGAIWLHNHRNDLLDLLNRLPRTLCHLDVWPNNVIATGDDMKFVDWAFVGEGALAEDIGNLVPDAVFDRFVKAREFDELADRTLDAYQRGLRDVDWLGDPALVEVAYFASSVKYDWLVPWMLAKASDEQHDYGGQVPVDAVERYSERGEILLKLTQRAKLALERADSLAL